MLVSQKERYALRAVLELALRFGRGPVRVSQVASAQAIPPNFLELILNELKKGGLVESRRGKRGGYLLVRPPADMTVGEVIRLVRGRQEESLCAPGGPDECPLRGDCVFLPMWQKAKDAMESVYDGTTFADLVEEERRRSARYAPAYSI